MPSGRTHDQITFWGLPGVIALSFLLVRRWELVLILSLAYLFSGLMFGPDLDIHSVQFKRWGWFRWLWLPYQKNLRHRSALSHGFLIGTIIRLLYLGGILLFVTIIGMAIAQLIFNFSWNWRTAFLNFQGYWQRHYWAESLALFVGLEMGAMSHSVSDWIGSKLKKSKTQGLFTVFFPKKLKKRRKSRPSRR